MLFVFLLYSIWRGNIMEEYAVVKFGGSSLSNAKMINEVLDIIISNNKRKYVVVSAPGKSEGCKYKVTDLLLNYSKDGNHQICQKPLGISKAESINQIISIYSKIMSDLGFSSDQNEDMISNLKSDFEKTFINQDEKDAFYASRGEHYNGKLIHQHLLNKNVTSSLALPEENGFLLKGIASNASFDMSCSDCVKNNLLSKDGIVIIPGYYGILSDNTVAVLPRSGSDITQTFVADSIGASYCENFTDVEFVLRANPAIVENPKSLKEICFDEIRELAYLDSKVPAGALPYLIRKRIPFYVKSTSNPSGEGTLICFDRFVPNDERIAGVASKKGYVAMEISKMLLNEQIGADAEISGVFRDNGISIEHIPSGIDNLSVIFEKNNISKRGLLDIVERSLIEKIPDADIRLKQGIAEVVVAGRGMRNHHDVASRTLNALAKEKIAPLMLNMGASDISFFIGVYEERADDAVRAIYGEFFSN
jgi:aspartate kinase